MGHVKHGCSNQVIPAVEITVTDWPSAEESSELTDTKVISWPGSCRPTGRQ